MRLRLNSNAVRGGVLENILMRNCAIGQVADAILQIDFVYEEGPNGPYKPVAKNIVIENVTSQKTPKVLNVVGFPASTISGVRVINSTFHNVQEVCIHPLFLSLAAQLRSFRCLNLAFKK